MCPRGLHLETTSKRSLVVVLHTKEWGDARSILDKYAAEPTDEINTLLKPYESEVRFGWDKEDGWHYFD